MEHSPCGRGSCGDHDGLGGADEQRVRPWQPATSSRTAGIAESPGRGVQQTPKPGTLPATS